MALWVPPSVTAEMMEERRAHTAEALRQLELRNELRDWNRQLKEIDSRLELVKAREDTTFPGLKPGYYHVVRHNEGAAPSFIVHEGPNGEFREPDSGLFERLRRGDMWNDRAMRDASERDRKLQAAAERQRAREREERVEELMDRAKAAWNPGVRVTRDIS